MNETSGAPAVVVENLVRSFEGETVRAVDGVDLTVASGEFVAITGSSGSGKSTLLHLIAALDRPTSGTIRVFGEDLRGRHDLDEYRRREIGLVFQLHNLLPHLDARENVEIAMFGTGMTRSAREARAQQLLTSVQLDGRERREPPRLSGGERQRVAIARALANEPRLLLADEPTGNLDSGSAAQVLGLFDQLRSEHGVTVVMVTHDPAVAATADRVVHMHDGRVVDEPAATGA